jgi:hypothetical protein
MWRWARAYGIGGASLYLVLVGLVLLLVTAESNGANVFWLALILGVPAPGAGLYLRGCLQESGIVARAERIAGWALMLTGVYGVISSVCSRDRSCCYASRRL